MKKIVLSIVLMCFVSFAFAGNTNRGKVLDKGLLLERVIHKSTKLEDKILTQVNLKVSEVSSKNVDFQCILLSCGDTVCWRNMNTSSGDIIFWYYIYDWMYC